MLCGYRAEPLHDAGLLIVYADITQPPAHSICFHFVLQSTLKSASDNVHYVNSHLIENKRKWLTVASELHKN